MPELMEFSFQELETRAPETIKIIQQPPYNVQISEFTRAEMKRMRDATQAEGVKKFQEAIGKDLADSMIQAARELTPTDMLLD